MLALMRGDIAGSWALHPWVPVLMAQLVVAVVLLKKYGADRLQRAIVPVLVANLVFGIALYSVRLSIGSIPAPFG